MSRQSQQECNYCKEKETKLRDYLEDIEKEKVRECLMALEREKIAKGMQCTKLDEIRLKEMQKRQMEEKRSMEQSEEDLDMMWHDVLLDDVRRKEYLEQSEVDRRHREMLERRRAYDEQIATTNRKRQEIIREEREKESRRLEKMMRKMEQDHYDAIKRKKDQQITNKKNYIEGIELKRLRVWNDKQKEREIDNGTIRAALEELRREEERKRMEMRHLQLEKQIFVENYRRERKTAIQIEEESDRVAHEWKRQDESKADDYVRRMEEEKRINKEKAAEEYKRHLKERKLELEKEREERTERMERVKRNAIIELHKKLDCANQELRKQIEYRNSLGNQIRENQRHVEAELQEIEVKDNPFTKKAEMFKDVMGKRYASSPARTSTNPVHPFRRMLETKEEKPIQLPLIGKRVYQ